MVAKNTYTGYARLRTSPLATPRLGYRAIRGNQRKRLMGTAFPLADPSISDTGDRQDVSRSFRRIRLELKSVYPQIAQSPS
jgi:hypothetical protein